MDTIVGSKCMVRGQAGELRWGYHEAAILGPWTLSADGAGGDLTATVVRSQAFRVQQPALTFRVSRQRAEPWKWPVLSLHIVGTTLYARLGPQE